MARVMCLVSQSLSLQSSVLGELGHTSRKACGLQLRTLWCLLQ